MERIFNKVKIKVDFKEPTQRIALTSGEELPTLMGKIKKYLGDLKNVAFSGKFSDLSNTADDTGDWETRGLTKLYRYGDYTYLDNLESIHDGALTIGAAASIFTEIDTSLQSLNKKISDLSDEDTCNFDQLFDEALRLKGDIIPDTAPGTTTGRNLGSSNLRFRTIYGRDIQATNGIISEMNSENYTGYYMKLGYNNSLYDDTFTGAAMFASGIDTGLAVGIGLKGTASGSGSEKISHQTVIGHYNSSMGASNTGTAGTAFIIGNGTSATNDSNAVRIDYDGSVYSVRTLLTGADYAEYMEWKDKNPDDEDRVGRFVTLIKDKIALANTGDYVIGVISGNASVIGNNDFDQWCGKNLRDDFGRLILGDVDIIDPGTGEVKVLHNEPQNNPDYDTSLTYVPRADRPEWDTVGMLGVLRVYDDGTCMPDGWCKVSKDGTATTAVITDQSFLTPIFKVMRRISDNVIEIFLK